MAKKYLNKNSIETTGNTPKKICFILLIIAVLVFITLAGCTRDKSSEVEGNGTSSASGGAVTSSGATGLSSHYSNVYVVFVYSFYDSDGDGVGDLQGVIQNLDYIANPETGLGANAIWMLPIHPATSYHMYDVTDYKGINPLYGTLDDFDQLVEAANERGISIIMDLVVNHTSLQHPWFLSALQEIREGLDKHYYHYYNFATENLPNYHPTIDGHYYEGVFWSGMPDLNFDSPEVKREVEEIVDFWLDRGVLGFRLDAAKHIYNTNPQNHEFWKWFTDMVYAKNPDTFLVAEVWEPETVVLPYYETGLTSLFNFRFEGSDGVISQAIRTSWASDFNNQVVRFSTLIHGLNPNAMDSIFLSNHDTNRSSSWLTTEETRKLAAAMYLMIPGVSYIYYGEELSMTGSGRDENKRAPMIWSISDQTGQTRGPAGMDQIPQLSEGVAEALERPGSLLNYYRQILGIKKRHPEIAMGMPTAIRSDGRSLAIYEVAHNGSRVIVAHNLSSEAIEIVVDLGDNVSIAERLNPSDADGGGFNWDGTTLAMPGYGTAVLR